MREIHYIMDLLCVCVCVCVFVSASASVPVSVCLSSHLNDVRVSNSTGHVHGRLAVRTRLKEEGEKEGRRREIRKKEKGEGRERS